MSEIPTVPDANSGDDLEAMMAAAVAEWSGKLDGFCADLESKGFRIQRDGLTVRILPPVELTDPKPTEAERTLWQGSDL